MTVSERAIAFKEADVVVIGGGISGLLAALRASEAGATVVQLETGGGASGWLQGVNVALGDADPRDSPSAHSEDILAEGHGLSDPGLVQSSVHEAVEAFHYLDALGMGFARNGDRYLQRHPSGSRFARCCYVPGMMWGGKARQVLGDALRSSGVKRLRLRVIRLVMDEGRVIGVVAVPAKAQGPVTVISAGAVVISSGGVGGLLARSTYPSDVSGSSYALALHAGAILRDMEFIQFEPLVGLQPDAIRGYVIPTTLFGDGAVMRDAAGARFLLDVRKEGEVGISKEELVLQMARKRKDGCTTATGGLWLDCREVSPATLAGYPWLQGFMTRHGINLTTTLVEVWPAAHTCLGGIVIDTRRQARGVEGLFVAGEAAGGLHGAGRLAGGSGTDVLASGFAAGPAAAMTAAGASPIEKGRLIEAANSVVDLSGAPNLGSPFEGLESLVAQTAQRLERVAGLYRVGADLEDALHAVRADLSRLWPRRPLAAGSLRLRVIDRLLVSLAILTAAHSRTESRGAHLREDFPQLHLEQNVPRGLALSAEKGLLAPVAID